MKKRNGKPDPGSMTLRDAFEAYYPKDELANRTIEKARYDLKRWEKLTDNPPVSKIDEGVLEDFRKALLATHAAASVNGTRTQIRAVLRRLGPAITGNPCGLGIIPRIPYMKPSKVIRGLPRRVDQDDLSRWYIACEQTQSPKWGGPAAFWWQAWLVIAYFSGLRKSDIFGIRFADLDLDKGTLLFTARKTMKPMRLPLHECVVSHVRRIEQPKREFLFESSIKASGSFNQRWDWICRRAGIDDSFSPHDIRRTAASEIERVKTGMASVLLQHSVNDTTHVSYLNQLEELAEAIIKMRVPIAFKHGPRQAERQLENARRQNAEIMRRATFSPPVFPEFSDWQFHNVGFIFRGHHVRMEGGALRVLKALALAPLHHCSLEEFATAIWPDGSRPANFRTLQGRICDCISTIRERLRHALLLPDSFNPCPCIERGRGGRWTLYIPTEPTAKGGAA